MLGRYKTCTYLQCNASTKYCKGDFLLYMDTWSLHGLPIYVYMYIWQLVRWLSCWLWRLVRIYAFRGFFNESTGNSSTIATSHSIPTEYSNYRLQSEKSRRVVISALKREQFNCSGWLGKLQPSEWLKMLGMHALAILGMSGRGAGHNDSVRVMSVCRGSRGCWNS